LKFSAQTNRELWPRV